MVEILLKEGFPIQSVPASFSGGFSLLPALIMSVFYNDSSMALFLLEKGAVANCGLKRYEMKGLICSINQKQAINL